MKGGGKKVLVGILTVEVVLISIVVIGGLIVIIASDKLTWSDYLADIMILAGALGIGGGIAAAGHAFESSDHD